MRPQASLTAALIMVSVLIVGHARAQTVPTTNYENSGVVSEMIGSNAAGITAYTSEFVARFTSERAKTRMSAAMVRLRNQYRTSQPLVSRTLLIEEKNPHLGLLFADPGSKNAAQNARRIRGALAERGVESGTIRALVRSLRGLLSGEQIDATGFVRAVKAYNRVLEEGTSSSLEDPPRAIRDLRLVLGSLMETVTSAREAESPSEAPFGKATVPAEQLRIPLPKNGNGIEIDAPLISPGTTIATPTAFGARWGQVYAGVSYQPVSRYATVSEYDWQKGKWSDGTISLGAGMGDPHRWAGLDVTLNIFDTLFGSLGASDEFGKVRTLSLKLHRALPYESAVALGYENAWYSRPEEEQGGSSIYGVLTKTFTLREPRASPFSRATLSVGLGTDRFLPEPKFQRQERGVNAFGSLGVRVWSFLNLVADWTGQDLNVGVSVTPIPSIPLVLTPALVDVTGNAGDQVRFSIGAAMTYDFRR